MAKTMAIERIFTGILGTAAALALWAQDPVLSQSTPEPAAPADNAAAEAGPADAPAPDPLAKGKYLAAAGNCISCHTAPGGEPFAGGVAFVTDFGTLYSTNITSDATAGIGGWTLEQFTRAMREGIDNDGVHLYPAFPYTAFTKIGDEDMAELFAYIKTIPPSSGVPPANEMGFPFNQRSLMAVWNALFFEPARFTPDTAQSAEWNRGAYLVEGLGHCGACHTPRNLLGAEKADAALSGGTYLDEVTGGAVRPWYAVNLTPSQNGLKGWTQDNIVTYLKTGHGTRVGSYGPMNEVITGSTMHLSDADVNAMAVYLKSLKPIENGVTQTIAEKDQRAGETLYTIHCGTCHLPTGLGSTPGSELGAPLVGSAVVQGNDPSTLINIILNGTEVITPAPAKGWKNMKAFGNLLDDDEVATLANYLRTSWGNQGGKVTPAQVAKQR
ncbi:MAG: cytochrome c [Rhodospirillaceae bacterium]|nr:cytochrome c [Rhodospirillaceae bacterium]